MVFLRPSFGACAPPSPDSAQNLYFLRRVGRLLMIILPSGILSRRSAPLSPKGKAVIGAVRHSPQKRKAIIDTACHSPRKKKRFPPSGKTFIFFTRLLNQNAGRLFLFASIKTNRKTFNNIK